MVFFGLARRLLLVYPRSGFVCALFSDFYGWTFGRMTRKMLCVEFATAFGDALCFQTEMLWRVLKAGRQNTKILNGGEQKKTSLE